MRIARIPLERSLLLAVSLWLAAIGAFGQRVTTDSAASVDWFKFRTYGWGAGTPVQDPLVAERIVGAIDAQLAAKGLTRVESNPDLLVMYHAATNRRRTLNWNSFGEWSRFGGMGSAQVDTIVTGQLKVDLADYRAKQFIWRGTATGTVSTKPKKSPSTLYKAIARMFEGIPARAENINSEEGASGSTSKGGIQ